MPYQTILTLACIALALRYMLTPAASVKWRLIIGTLTLASVSLPTPPGIPWTVATVLLQLAICLFVLLRQKAVMPGR
jgi:hypothetical protein